VLIRHFLHQEGYLLASPAEQLVPPAMEEQQPRFLTEAEYQRLLAAARHHPRDLAILELFLQTRIRGGELANVLLTVAVTRTPPANAITVHASSHATPSSPAPS
jgi:integrase